ncbi:hypothetical protein AB0O67_29270 [Streptomyces sp. NPDC086077]
MFVDVDLADVSYLSPEACMPLMQDALHTLGIRRLGTVFLRSVAE